MTAHPDDAAESCVSIAWAQPDRLAVIAALSGLSPTPPSRARVLALGCGDGSHVVAMAARYPASRFVGADTSRLQVEQGNKLIDALGLANVTIVHADWGQMQRAADAEPYDYILCHEVFSTEPGTQQDDILRLCRDALAPDGVLYISYATYPGWKMREVVRDITRFHARNTTAASHTLAHARAMMALIRDVAHAKTAYGRMLINEAASLNAQSDANVLRENFELDIRPCYFSDFVIRARAHGLAYLGESELGELAVNQRGKKLLAALDALAGGDWLAAEQYMDFLRNRAMRQSLLVPARIADRVDRVPRAALLERFHSSCAFELVTARSPYDQERVFASPAGRSIKTENLGIHAMMRAWAEAYPQSLGFDDLLAATRHKRFGQNEAPTPGAVVETLLRFANEGIVQLHVEPVRLGKARDARPRAFEPARMAARNGLLTVFNARLEPVAITQQEAMLLGLLDGSADAARLREQWLALADRGLAELWPIDASETDDNRVHDRGGKGAADANERRAAAANMVRRSLRRFERSALLLPANPSEPGARDAPDFASTAAP